MIFDNLSNGYNYISAKLNRGYKCISYNTKSFISPKRGNSPQNKVSKKR